MQWHYPVKAPSQCDFNLKILKDIKEELSNNLTPMKHSELITSFAIFLGILVYAFIKDIKYKILYLCLFVKF